MALISFWHTKAAIKMIGKELKTIAFIANIIAQITMLVSLTYNLITTSGLWYINLPLLVLSIAYSIFTIVDHIKEIKKETKNEIKKVFRWAKWVKCILKAFPIVIALYDLFIASSNLTPITLISPIVITAMWLFNILLNIVYLVIETKVDLFLDCIVEDLGDTPFIGKIICEATEKLPNNTPQNPKFAIIQEMATADKEAWEEKNQQFKTQQKEERREKIAGFFSNILKKSK